MSWIDQKKEWRRVTGNLDPSTWLGTGSDPVRLEKMKKWRRPQAARGVPSLGLSAGQLGPRGCAQFCARHETGLSATRFCAYLNSQLRKAGSAKLHEYRGNGHL
jgi:hypothetical protein